MQRRRAAEGTDGGGNAADERTADQMLDELMEDLNASSGSPLALKSVQVVENRDQAQPEGGTQEVVGAGAVEAQSHGGAQLGVMESFSPDQQATAEVLRSGVQLQWQAAPPAALVDAGRRPEHLPGGPTTSWTSWRQRSRRPTGWSKRVTEVFWVLLQFLLVAWSRWCFDLAWSRWCFDLKVSLLLHKVILWFTVLLDIKGMLNDNKGILLHKCNMVDINLALVNFFGIPDPHGVYAVMRTPDGVGGQRNPFWSDLAMVEVINMLPVDHMEIAPNELYHQDGWKQLMVLTHKDLLDLEALRVQGFKEVEAGKQWYRKWFILKCFGGSRCRTGFKNPCGSGSWAIGDASICLLSNCACCRAGTCCECWRDPQQEPEEPGAAQAVHDSSLVDSGDWLAIVGPLMSDLSGTSSQWWALDAAAKT